MKGAEIALVEGLRVTVGSGDDCDIVLADAALPPMAFMLDVTAEAVSFIRGEETRTLVPFEIVDIGTSAIAIGPADRPWEPLKREVKGKGEEELGNGSSSEGAATADASPTETGAPPAVEGLGKPAAARGGAEPEKPRKRRVGILLVCFTAIVLVILLALWYFWSVVSGCVDAYLPKSGKVAVVVQKGPSLAELARQYDLTLTNYPRTSIEHPLTPDLCPLLRGNLKRRAERLAIRALALAADPLVKLELTDDQTLFSSAEEILFVLTEGDLSPAVATNGVVELAGFVPSIESLAQTIRAMNADVPGLRAVLTKGVRIGGMPPPAPPKEEAAPKERTEPDVIVKTVTLPDPYTLASRDALISAADGKTATSSESKTSTTNTATSSDVKIAAVKTAAQPGAKSDVKPAATKTATASDAMPASKQQTAAPSDTKAKDVPSYRVSIQPPSPKPTVRVFGKTAAKTAPKYNFPIAGILTTPYNTVVLDNGLRVTEGGLIGTAIVNRIEPDRLFLRTGETVIEWIP